jgi:hypothetical protein
MSPRAQVVAPLAGMLLGLTALGLTVGATRCDESSVSASEDRSTLGAIMSRRAVPMQPTPSAALGICQQLPLIRATCPRRVPGGPYTEARRPPGFHGVAAGGAIALCATGVPIASRGCTSQSWILEAGAPAGLPSDAPPELGQKRLDSRRTRPPQYVHLIIYAARGNLGPSFPFAWPHGHAQPIHNRLLRPSRTKPIFFGHRDWAGHNGSLVLAPPLASGGENGDHVIFRWQEGGVAHAISLHAWVPLREAVATLRAMVV